MAKYSFEFKMKIVQEYNDGNGSQGELIKKYGIPSRGLINKWIKNYEAFGEKGLLRKRNNTTYTLDFKLSMIECYLTTEISYQNLAIQHNITNPALIASWVSTFRHHGIEGLSQKQGKLTKVKKDKNIKMTTKKLNSNNNSERVKELENQILALRIENAYLKEMRRLRLEETQKTKRLQELLEVSEDHSN